MTTMYSRSVLLLALLAVLAGSVMSGCSYRRTATDPTITFDFNAGPVSIDVENFAGDVMITADERAKETTVRIVRDSRHGIARYLESQESFSDIHVDVDTVPGDLGPVLRVRTATVNPEPHFQRVHVHIRTPQVQDVSVNTTRGKVYVENNQGPVDIRTTRGDVRVLTNWPMNHPISIETRDGDIVYHVRGESRGAYYCTAEGGRIHHRVRYGEFRIQEGTDPNTLVARLNDGTNPVRLHTEEGDVYVAVVAEPTAISRFRIKP